MRRAVTVFCLANHSAAPERGLDVEGEDLDTLERNLRAALERRYERVHTVSFTPSGMVAYVEGPRP